MLVIKNLEKSYGRFKALNGLNLEIKKGEIFGFVGPNGAGKTTSMKIISGLLSPDSGEVYIEGIDAIKDNKVLKEKIGYMPDFFGVYDNLTALEYLEFYASIYGILGEEGRKLSLELLELVNLADKRDSNVNGLSRGMKQRLCLARCLVHNPELLILDEPASGMDPRARFEMKNILKNLKDMGKTILISSHILPELAEICTNLGIIEKGKLIVQGTVEEIMIKMNHSRPIKLKVLSKVEEAISILAELPNIDKPIQNENEILFGFKGKEKEVHEILKQLIDRDIDVISFTQENGSLEDVFMRITEMSNGGDFNEN
ncbi:ABC transporter ATP-binding protein [Clostridium sp. 'White wine YQ']|uniref:ABC transporter ATP-binding protein n=1 Tax=Clostridium sp. 'White wine YQ' TaxID=3027474 RepID=UPI002365A57D|nr:ABC transporter ATP-binding protein [Clostridium sp. 'White wine YQ']MDD7792885.1 ABC transporter ATP-binding protein [Clostridium sp. 'White wine YQ']